MTLNRIERVCRRRRRLALGAALTGLGCVAFVWCATAQVTNQATVQTIGGGVRTECGSAAGFVAGNTYEIAQFHGPSATVLDAQGNLWLADSTNSDVEEISQPGNTTSSITTHITASIPAKYHAFTDVNGVALDASGYLYVLLPHSGVTKYQVASPHLTKLSEADFAAGSVATALLVDNSSNVYVAFTNGIISRFTMPDLTTNKGPFTSVVSGFKWEPAGMTLCANGSLGVSDTLSNAIYVVNTNSGAVALLTGGNGVGYGDGSPALARFQKPHGLAASADGRIVVCDTGNNRLRVIDANTNTTTLYGTDTNVWTATLCANDPAYYAGWVDGQAGPTQTSASGREPVSVTIAPSGTLFVTELYYDLIRSVTGSGLTPVLPPGSVVTPGQAPVVTTLIASGITATSATLNATVNPEGQDTMAYFQWSTSTNAVNTTTFSNLTTDLSTVISVSSTLTNLLPSTTYYYEALAENDGGTTNGNVLSFQTLASTTGQLPPPTFSPSNGYYPECVTIDVTSSNQTVYYTTDGSAPTTASTELSLFANGSGAYTNSFQWCNPQKDLSSLRIIAFNGTNVSAVAQGAVFATNLIGFPQTTYVGSGSTAYIPVVAELRNSGVLQSLQYRVEIAPGSGSPPPISGVTLQPITADDFVPLLGPAPGNTPVTYSTFAYTNPVNQAFGLVIATEPGSGLNIQGFAVPALLRVPIPKGTVFGQSYSLTVLDPSGTSDGIATSVGLTNLPAQELKVTDPIYMSGDSSPANGYNAGEFGNGSLDNSDANNILYAIVGIRKPYTDSDAFNAMDVYPETNGLAGFGQGHLVFLDWQITLDRSVGLNTNNWIRFWTNFGSGGVLSHSDGFVWTPGGPPVVLSDESSSTAPRKLAISASPPGLVWFCQASISADNATGLQPGNTCSFPVYANVLPGNSLSGMDFRAVVTPNGGAPAVGQVQFNPAPGIPVPAVLPGLSANDIICAWELGSFEPPLQNSGYIGTITFQVPQAAVAGQTYSLHFMGAGGAPDGTTSYQMESFPAAAGVGSAALPTPSLTSDDWKLAFFGSLTNPQAADDADPDGDGALNWQEYLAGTNPTNARSYLQFSSAALNPGVAPGVALNWLTAPGKTYVVESEPVLGTGNWTNVNTNNGDGNYYQLLITNYSGSARFYQIRLQR